MTTPTVITKVVSESSGAVYEIRLGADANVYCTCPAWKFQKLPPKERTCKHMKAVSGKIAAFAKGLSAPKVAAPVAAPPAAAPVMAPAPVAVVAPAVDHKAAKVALAQAKVKAAQAALVLAQAEVELAEALAA